MEWHPAGWTVCLPLLIFPCTIKSRGFSSGTGSPRWSRKKSRKMVVCVCVWCVCVCLTPLSPHRYNLTIINEHYHFMTTDRFSVPVRSAAKSHLTAWCCKNLSKHALNSLTVQASTTEFGRLFQVLTTHAEKNAS